MKRKLCLGFILCLFLGMLCGCQNNPSNVENTIDDSQVTEATEEEKVPAVLEGDFTVTVRELLPDYVLDAEVPRCAVVTYFQSSPFVLDVGDRTSELEVGEQYTFTIKDKPIGDVPKSEIGSGLTYLEACVKYSPIEIESFRKATEDELGLNGESITISKAI